MPSTINRYPQGLLSLFDMKARGTTPPLLDDVTQLGFDVTQLYAASNRRVWAESFALTASSDGWNSSTALHVPQNEIWLLDWLSILSSSTGGAMQLTGGFDCLAELPAIPDSGTTVVLLCDQYYGAGSAGKQVMSSWTSRQPFIVPQGARFGIYCMDAGGTCNATLNIGFTPLSV